MCRRNALICIFLLFAALPAHAITLRISAPALERTLRNQVFKTPPPKPDLPPRVYLRGKPGNGCSVFADDPRVTFLNDRVVVSIHTHANFGASIHGHCLGVWINTESVVSFQPEAQGESIGFRDTRIDKLSDSTELNALLTPFLARRLPAEMKTNAATLMRTLLVRSPDATGYTLTLTSLAIHSMTVQADALVVDLDADVRVD